MIQETVKTRPLLVPQYMTQFSCIGSACEDSCCIGWRVNIDEDTYRKYKKSRDTELKPLFGKNVTRQRSNTTSTSYAKIKMGNGGRCSFLSEENLCKVQLNLGEELLSNTCAIYPRTINSINGVIEKSATMSCPEAARLALLNPKGIEFDEIEESTNTRGFMVKQIETEHSKYRNKPQKYFWELRIFSIQVLQDRTYTLAERLIILGMFYQKIQEQINKDGDVYAIPNEIAKFTNLMANQGMKDLLVEIPVQLAVQMELCKELVDYRYGQGINSQRYIECLTEMLQGIQYTREATIEEVTEYYKKSLKEYYEPFMTEHEYILENYLVNYIFKNLFPLEQKTLFEDYIMLVIHYSLIKLHLIGMAGFHKGLTNDLVIKLIQSFAKTVEHNNTYLNKVLNLLKVNDFATMPYMAILVKN
ncbi:flagellin lysine-N-methylase [Cytobacillus firmus]|uniref:flagellin lysine-N-methylase n=1 Tax=Cytobacillus firmus TaxID=1399 RepID=UPI001C8D7D93|nr:flagellin lysine-N-methylase [Cytobacillus firmus]MBX9974389.1 flagellin lysine-N-methylase [Cytobacillus firmus]